MKIDELIALKPEDSFFAMVEGDLREFCKEEVYQIAFESLEPHTEEYTVELNTHGRNDLPIEIYGWNIFATIGDVVYFMLDTIGVVYSDVISEDSEVIEAFKNLSDLINFKDGFITRNSTKPEEV